jgi:hypothetical protein
MVALAAVAVAAAGKETSWQQPGETAEEVVAETSAVSAAVAAAAAVAVLPEGEPQTDKAAQGVLGGLERLVGAGVLMAKLWADTEVMAALVATPQSRILIACQAVQEEEEELPWVGLFF